MQQETILTKLLGQYCIAWSEAVSCNTLTEFIVEKDTCKRFLRFVT